MLENCIPQYFMKISILSKLVMLSPSPRDAGINCIGGITVWVFNICCIQSPVLYTAICMFFLYFAKCTILLYKVDTLYKPRCILHKLYKSCYTNCVIYNIFFSFFIVPIYQKFIHYLNYIQPKLSVITSTD